MKKLRKSALLVLIAPPLLLATSACGWIGTTPFSDAEAALENRDFASARLYLAEVLNETPGDHVSRALYAETLLALSDGIGAQAALEKLPADVLADPKNAALMAHAQLLQNNYDAAKSWADKAGEAEPLAAWVRVGAMLLSGEDVEAGALADKAIARFPGDARLLALRGEIALNGRQVEQAKALADKAVAADGRDLNARLLAGRLALLREDIPAAEKHYLAAVAANQSIVGPRLSLAAVQADLGKLDEAEASLKSARDIAPGHPVAMLLDAKLAFVKGDLEGAHRIMQDAESQLRKVPAAQLLQGEIAHLRGTHEQAIAFLRPFLRDNPGHAQGSVVMAQALIAVGDRDKALAILELPASRASASPQLLALASSLAKQTGSPDPYAARLDSAAPPKDLSQRLAQADRAIAQKDWPKARQIYSGLRKDGVETHSLVLNNGALAEMETGNFAEAVKLARRAAALTPQDPQVMDTLGWVLLQAKGDKSEALQWLGKAKQAMPGNLEIRWHYAVALAANGRKAEARAMAAGVREFADPAQRKHIDEMLARL